MSQREEFSEESDPARMAWRLDKATVQRRVKFSEESESAIGSLEKRAAECQR
jgi:hypothetical protein